MDCLMKEKYREWLKENPRCQPSPFSYDPLQKSVADWAYNNFKEALKITKEVNDERKKEFTRTRT